MSRAVLIIMENPIGDLKELNEFMGNIKIRVENLLKIFDWNENDTKKEFTTNHVISNHSVLRGHKATKNNKLIKKEIKDDPYYPESLTTWNSVKLDPESINCLLLRSNPIEEIPQKFSDAQINFNRDEKIAVYEYIIKKTKKLNKLETSGLKNQNESTENKGISLAEIDAMNRDLKRRRLKYRTSKYASLSLTEELRNLISTQMEELVGLKHNWKEGKKYRITNRKLEKYDIRKKISKKSKKSKHDLKEIKIN